jgi:hypothetical protein
MKPPRPPQFLADEERLHTWFYRLDLTQWTRPFSLDEINGYTRIPLRRLPDTLRRAGWQRERSRAYKIDLWISPWRGKGLYG